MLRHISTRLVNYTCLRRAAQIDLHLRPCKHPLVLSCVEVLHVRHKYVTSGVQGRRNSKTASKKYSEVDGEDDFDEIENAEERVNLKNRYENRPLCQQTKHIT